MTAAITTLWTNDPIGFVLYVSVAAYMLREKFDLLKDYLR